LVTTILSKNRSHRQTQIGREAWASGLVLAERFFQY